MYLMSKILSLKATITLFRDMAQAQYSKCDRSRPIGSKQISEIRKKQRIFLKNCHMFVTPHKDENVSVLRGQWSMCHCVALRVTPPMISIFGDESLCHRDSGVRVSLRMSPGCCQDLSRTGRVWIIYRGGQTWVPLLSTDGDTELTRSEQWLTAAHNKMHTAKEKQIGPGII